MTKKTRQHARDIQKELDQKVKEARVLYGVPIDEFMRPCHPRWREFYKRLSGPEGCNFKRKDLDDPKTTTWRCKGDRDKTSARRTLRRMGFSKGQIEVSCLYFESRGGFCDCEVIWNVEPRRVRKPGRKS